MTFISVATYMLKTILRFSWVLLLLLSACDQSDESLPEVRLIPETGTVDYNGTFTLSWTTTGIDYCLASGDWVGNLKRSGSKTLGPLTRDSFYVLNCYSAGKEFSESVTAKVRTPKIPEVNLSASPLSVAFQGSTTITWSSNHVQDCIATGDWSGQQKLSNTIKVEGLEKDSEFGLICSGPQGEVSEHVNINVAEAGIKVPRVNLTATPAITSYNGSTKLSWNTQDADICRASGNWFGSKARSGTKTVRQLKTDRKFILTCTIAGGGGGEGIDAVEVKVLPAPPPTVKLTASPPQVANNGATTLRWSSSHADSCIAIGDWSGTKSISGTLTISGLRKESVFSLKCTGDGGLGTDSITVTLQGGNE